MTINKLNINIKALILTAFDLNFNLVSQQVVHYLQNVWFPEHGHYFKLHSSSDSRDISYTDSLNLLGRELSIFWQWNMDL